MPKTVAKWPSEARPKAKAMKTMDGCRCQSNSKFIFYWIRELYLVEWLIIMNFNSN